MNTYLLESADAFVGNGGAGTGRLLETILEAAGVDAEGVTPAAVFEAFSDGRNPALHERVAGRMTVVAAPGERLAGPLETGDIVLSRAPGEPGRGQAAVVVDGLLRPLPELAEAGLAAGTRALPGLYVHAVDELAGGRPSGERFARRVADSGGYVPLGEMVVRFADEPVETVDVGDGIEWPLSLEARPVAEGRLVVQHVPLLARHRGTPPDLILRWNAMADVPATVDVVVHLHGYSGRAERMRLDRDKEPYSGLDFANPDDPRDTTPGRISPTLAVLPRGNFFGGRNGDGYDFPALATAGGLRDLRDLALVQLAGAIGAGPIAPGRLIVTAHSGGGAALMLVLRHNDPDEIEVFDALYGSAVELQRWALAHLSADAAALAGGTSFAQLGSLRVLYRPAEGTEAHSVALGRTLATALASLPSSVASALAPRYAVVPVHVAHGDIPRRYGWRLLGDAGTAVPGTATGAPVQSVVEQPAPHQPPPAPPAQQPAPPAPPAQPAPLAGLTPAEEKALRISNAFENTSVWEQTHDLSFGGLTGNFDGQGLSFGLLQWNIGTGSLQPLLHELDQTAPAQLDAAFGAEAPALRAMLAQTPAQQLAFARGINDAHNRIVEPWRSHFGALAADPAFQQIEIAHVLPKLHSAEARARELCLTTERGLALMFDCATQGGDGWLDNTHCHGCATQTRRQRIAARRAQLAGQGPIAERDVLRAVAEIRAATSLPRFQADVRARGLTIVDGTGTVHGHQFDLAHEFGLGDTAWDAPAAVPVAPAPAPAPPQPPHPAHPAHEDVAAVELEDVPEDDEALRALARQQWDAHPEIHHAFEHGFPLYLDLWPLYHAHGIDDPAAYIAANITTVTFLGHHSPGHRDLRAPLAAAESTLAAAGPLPAIHSFWSFNPRRIHGSTSLSKHSVGRALDIDPTSNPMISDRDDILVIHAATGVDFGRAQTAAALRAASDAFRQTYTAAWAAQQTSDVAAAARRRAYELAQYARYGLLTLDQSIIDALVGAGLTWGGSWPHRKDLMHFELSW